MNTRATRFTKLLGTLALGVGATVALSPATASAAGSRCHYGHYSADSGAWLASGSVSYYCDNGEWGPQRQSCFYAGSWTAHGDTLQSYQCHDGTWSRAEYKQCRYEGQAYKHGKVAYFKGYEQECYDGTWNRGEAVYCYDDYDNKRYSHGESRRRSGYEGLYEAQCDSGAWGKWTPVARSYDRCEYKGESYKHGKVAYFKGYEHECYDGTWNRGEAVYCYDDYDNKRYSHGESRRRGGKASQCDSGAWGKWTPVARSYDRCEYQGAFYDHGDFDYGDGYKWQCDDGGWERDVVACEWQGQWVDDGQWLEGSGQACLCTSRGWEDCRPARRW